MSIASQVDALARLRRSTNSGPWPGVEGLKTDLVGYYCRRGRDLQALAMRAALRSAVEGVLALRRKLPSARATPLPSH